MKSLEPPIRQQIPPPRKAFLLGRRVRQVLALSLSLRTDRRTARRPCLADQVQPAKIAWTHRKKGVRAKKPESCHRACQQIQLVQPHQSIALAPTLGIAPNSLCGSQ